MRHSVLPPTSLVQVISLLAELDDRQCSLLKKAIQDKRSFDLGKNQRLALANETDLSVETISYLLSALSYLFNQLGPTANEPETIAAEKIDTLLAELQRNTRTDFSVDILKSRLKDLLAYSKSHETYMKVARLEAGFIASATSFASFVDLRPSFSADRSEIEGYVPIIQFNIATDSPRSHESSIVVQLDMESLNDLKEAIADIEHKLDLLTSEGQLFLPILTSYADDD